MRLPAPPPGIRSFDSSAPPATDADDGYAPPSSRFLYAPPPRSLLASPAWDAQRAQLERGSISQLRAAASEEALLRRAAELPRPLSEEPTLRSQLDELDALIRPLREGARLPQAPAAPAAPAALTAPPAAAALSPAPPASTERSRPPGSAGPLRLVVGFPGSGQTPGPITPSLPLPSSPPLSAAAAAASPAPFPHEAVARAAAAEASSHAAATLRSAHVRAQCAAAEGLAAQFWAVPSPFPAPLALSGPEAAAVEPIALEVQRLSLALLRGADLALVAVASADAPAPDARSAAGVAMPRLRVRLELQADLRTFVWEISSARQRAPGLPAASAQQHSFGILDVIALAVEREDPRRFSITVGDSTLHLLAPDALLSRDWVAGLAALHAVASGCAAGEECWI